MKKKAKFSVKRVASGDVALQITSMADIFTIILVFLLKSFTSGALNVAPGAGVKLPVAAGDEAQVEALKVEIAQKTVQVEDTVVSKLENFRFPGADLREGVSTSLEAALKTRRQRQDLIAKANSDVQKDDKLLIVADQRTPTSL